MNVTNRTPPNIMTAFNLGSDRNFTNNTITKIIMHDTAIIDIAMVSLSGIYFIIR